jgi:hypothetical protein
LGHEIPDENNSPHALGHEILDENNSPHGLGSKFLDVAMVRCILHWGLKSKREMGLHVCV